MAEFLAQRRSSRAQKNVFENDGDADATMDVCDSRERHRVNDRKLNLERKNKNRTISFIRTRRKKFLSPVCNIGDENVESKCRMIYSREREEGGGKSNSYSTN